MTISNANDDDGQSTSKDIVDQRLAIGLLVLGALAMGASPSFARWSGLDIFASAFCRVGVAIPILFLWASLESRSRAGTPGLWQNRPRLLGMNKATILAGLLFAGDLAFWHLSIFNTSMANATLLACLTPVWVLLLSGVVLGESVTRTMLLGVFVCFAGAVILVGGGLVTNPDQLVGDIYGLITSMFFGLYLMTMRFARRATRKDAKVPGPATLTYQYSVVTAVVLFLIALYSGENFIPTHINGYLALLALGAISHAGGQGLLAVSIASLSAAFSSLVIFMEVVAAVLLGWLFFAEPLGLHQSIGGAMILIGIYIARPVRSPKSS